MKKDKINLIVYLITLSVFISTWVFLTDVVGIKKIFLPRINDTFVFLIREFENPSFWLDLGASWFRVSVAFIISLVLAYSLVFLSLLKLSIKDSLFIIVEFFRYLPIPVFVPLTILWFGASDMGKIIIIFLGTFTQMIPMFYDSTMLVNNQYGAAKAALKWSKWMIIKKIILKGSAPYIFDNARLTLGWAWTYLVIAEMLGANHGIGYAIIRAQRYLATDKIFAYIIVIGLMGILTDRLMRLLRNKLYPWAN